MRPAPGELRIAELHLPVGVVAEQTIEVVIMSTENFCNLNYSLVFLWVRFLEAYTYM